MSALWKAFSSAIRTAIIAAFLSAPIVYDIPTYASAIKLSYQATFNSTNATTDKTTDNTAIRTAFLSTV